MFLFANILVIFKCFFPSGLTFLLYDVDVAVAVVAVVAFAVLVVLVVLVLHFTFYIISTFYNHFTFYKL